MEDDFLSDDKQNYKVKLNKKQVYDTGASRDDVSGKGRFDLISDFALIRLAHVYQKGGENHGDRNWEKGIKFSRLVDSAIRHLIQYKMSKYMLELCEEDHLGHSAWNIFALIQQEEMVKRGSLPSNLDDLPLYEKIESPKIMVSDKKCQGDCKCKKDNKYTKIDECVHQCNIDKNDFRNEDSFLQEVGSDKEGNRVVSMSKNGKLIKEIKYFKNK